VSNLFDDALDATLDSIEASGAWDAPTPPEIVRFDLRATLELIAGDVASAGGNFTDACFDSEHYHDSQIAERLFHADCEPTAGGPVRFEDFVFWDVIHPTGMAHAAIGESMAGALPGRSPP
jgi:phospholipase/lecithinase/hemolysin